MLKKIIIATVLLSNGVGAVHAQQSLGSQLTNAKFQVIKAAIEFLATDNRTYPNVKAKTCPACKSYADLQRFADDNKMNGVKEFMQHWQAVRLDTTAAEAKTSLDDFIKRLSDTLVTGGQKPQRKQLTSYQRFSEAMEGIQNGVVLKPAAQKKTETPAVPPVNDSTLVNSGSVIPPVVDDPDQEWLPSKYLLFGEALIILLLAFYIVLKQQDRKREDRRREKDYSRSQEGQEKQLENALYRLRSAEQELLEAQQANQAFQTLLNELRSQQTTNTAPANRPVPEPPPITRPTVAEPELKYARYADAGDGFSNSDLLTQEDSETVFEIKMLAAGVAEYRVTRNLAAQKYALANANYFLSKTCKYDTSPGGIIVTDLPGQLRLQGNKWQITDPAKISFQNA